MGVFKNKNEEFKMNDIVTFIGKEVNKENFSNECYIIAGFGFEKFNRKPFAILLPVTTTIEENAEEGQDNTEATKSDTSLELLREIKPRKVINFSTIKKVKNVVIEKDSSKKKHIPELVAVRYID